MEMAIVAGVHHMDVLQAVLLNDAHLHGPLRRRLRRRRGPLSTRHASTRSLWPRTILGLRGLHPHLHPPRFQRLHRVPS